MQGLRPRRQGVRVHSHARVGCGDIYHRSGTRPGLRCKTPRAPLLRPHCIPNCATASGAASQARVGGKGSDQIAKEVQAAYVKGELPKMEKVAFASMFSADRDLGLGLGAWHPHMMVSTPYYENSMLGGNEPDSRLPIVGNGGTQFAVTVIPVDDRLAVKPRLGTLLPTEKPRKE